MKTPYLDQYIKVLEEDAKKGNNSFYENCKLREFKKIKKQLRLYGVSQQRELLIAYNVDFYKGIHDVTLKDIEHKVDKYLSNL